MKQAPVLHALVGLPLESGENMSGTSSDTSHSHGEQIPLDPYVAFDLYFCDKANRAKADVDVDPEVAAAGPKKRMFRKFSYRGMDLDALLDMSSEDLVGLFPARARRRFSRGLKRKPMALVKTLCKAVIDGSLFTLVCS
ncbi:40S ribosomal protein S15-like [Triticum urartu]|uniref:40S ribosomal protein S15-like n=1 Tax=Triticum urartu TaxID=4572 RepID=UPI002044AE66|nr:40S ribosomal protein S15-like [Triticum urartu]